MILTREEQTMCYFVHYKSRTTGLGQWGSGTSEVSSGHVQTSAA